MDDLKETFQKDSSVYIAEINGNDIQSLQDYFKVIDEVFKFPTPTSLWAGYFDWIRDLDWLQKERFVLIINQFSDFLKEDTKLKNEIVSDFTEVILPFWEEEVERVVVEGKAKPFNVYLVD